MQASHVVQTDHLFCLKCGTSRCACACARKALTTLCGRWLPSCAATASRPPTLRATLLAPLLSRTCGSFSRRWWHQRCSAIRCASGLAAAERRNVCCVCAQGHGRALRAPAAAGLPQCYAHCIGDCKHVVTAPGIMLACAGLLSSDALWLPSYAQAQALTAQDWPPVHAYVPPTVQVCSFIHRNFTLKQSLA